MLCVWYAKRPSVAFVFKGLDSPFQVSCRRPALASIDHRVSKFGGFCFTSIPKMLRYINQTLKWNILVWRNTIGWRNFHQLTFHQWHPATAYICSTFCDDWLSYFATVLLADISCSMLLSCAVVVDQGLCPRLRGTNHIVFLRQPPSSSSGRPTPRRNHSSHAPTHRL